MSLTSGPINEGEQSAEKFLKQAEADAPDTFAGILRKCLDVMAEYEVAFGLRKRQ